jgi:hypothetical protein
MEVSGVANFSPNRVVAVHPVDRGVVPRSATRSRACLTPAVRVVVDLAAGHDRHPLVEQAGERPDDAGLGLTALAEEDHVVAREQRVLQLRHHRVLVAHHTVEQGLTGGDPRHGVGADLLLHRP